ncbi:hypothetical protein, partial [Staphylococcus aureus]|uniref:hypothetical protein n=1 Tax=Staphylococcus aureus TaxID=1280 RepID=UPI002043C7FA
LNQVTTAKNALNGDANVRQAKSDAKANLGTLTHLNNAQKQDLTSQIEGATTVNGVNGVKTKAQDLLFSIYTILRIEWLRFARLSHYCKIL